MNLKDWAEREVAAACKRENPDWDGTYFDYGCACYQSALKAYKSLLEDSHSGASFSFTRDILIKLMNGVPLTPITEEDFDGTEPFKWNDRKFTSFSCPRMSNFWKDVYPDGSVYYHDNERVTFIDELGLGWHSGLASDIIHKRHPITLPYTPSTKPFKVFGYGYMVDLETNRVWWERGTFNFLYFSHYVDLNGKKHRLNKMFIETSEGFVELTDIKQKKTILKNCEPIIAERKAEFERK